jgi:hypothetical protein
MAFASPIRRRALTAAAAALRGGGACSTMRAHARSYTSAPGSEATGLAAQMVGYARQRWRGGHRSEAVGTAWQILLSPYHATYSESSCLELYGTL